MKTLKKIGLGFLGLVILLIAAGFLLPRHSHVERSLVMKANAATAFNQVNTLKNWEKWSPWHNIDPAMKLEYEGPESGAGAKYIWTSTNSNVGNGALTILASQPNQKIVSEMDFMENGKATGTYLFEENPEGTKLTWAMDSDLGMNPVARYFGLFMENFVGKDFEKGLNNIKVIVEKEPLQPAASYQVIEKQYPGMQVLTIRSISSLENLSENLGNNYGEILAFMEKNGLTQAGAPFAIYHKYDPKAIEFEAGIPVNKAAKSAGKIVAKAIKAGPVAMVAHYGKYEDTEKAHAFADTWLTENKKQVSGAPWEVYVTDPMTEKDQAKWLTEIYYPL